LLAYFCKQFGQEQQQNVDLYQREFSPSPTLINYPLVSTFLLLGFSDLRRHWHVLGGNFFSNRNVEINIVTRYGLGGPGIEFQ
jgi:hypothetical protein